MDGDRSTQALFSQSRVIFDMTHLVSQIGGRRTTGIERVDIAYGHHLTADRAFACGVHFWHHAPHRISPDRAGRIMQILAHRPRETIAADDDPGFRALREWIAGSLIDAPRTPFVSSKMFHGVSLARGIQRLRHHLGNDRTVAIPRGGIYLNVSQYGFEHHRFFRWLDERADLQKVFMVHDLLPLDYPEYFRTGYRGVFERRLETVLHHATALIVSTSATRERISRELQRQNKPHVPLCVAPLPSPLGSHALTTPDELRRHSYFVMIGTIEPRKNHLLLLHVWRELAARGDACPKLVVLGARGWDNEQIVDLLERSPALRPHVIEVPRLAANAVRTLLANACALLMPSFAEGYGLPLVEALTLHVPVVASDIAVFRDVTQGCATFASPLDGPAWRRAILDLAERDSASARVARATAATFRPPRAAEYFATIENFLAEL